MNKKETAIEWYSNKLMEILGDMSNEFSTKQTLANHYALKQAKEMEKEQMINFATIAYQDVSTLMNVPFNQISENKINFETVYNRIYND